MDYQRPLFQPGYTYINITTSAVPNTAVTSPVLAAIVATQCRRLQMLSIAATQGVTGNIYVTFDDTAGNRIAFLAISPQSPFAQLVIPSPGIQLVPGAGMTATHTASVANQGLRIAFADVFDIQS